MKRIVVLCLLALLSACGGSAEEVYDVLERFDVPPDTEPLVAVIKSAVPLAHIVTAATAEMFGEDIDFAEANITCTEFPCAAVADVILSDDSIFRPYTSASSAHVAALWPSETQSVMVILLYGGTFGSPNYQVQSVHSFPVSRRGSDLLITFADIDIDIAGETDDPAALTANEIARELERLNTPIPTDYEVALGMEAWVVNVITQGSSNDLNDDRILISGGGQYVAVDETAVDVYQLGLVGVEMDATCTQNPLDGLAIIQAVDTREFIFGQAVLEFDRLCDGRARVVVANGNYIGTIGDYIDLSSWLPDLLPRR
jgi:hypothetical protein